MSTSIVKAGEIATPTWTEQQRNLIRKTVCPPNTTDLEFEFFSAFCAQTGLNPLLKQAWLIPRKQKNPITEKYEEKMEPQVAEIGMRARADSMPDYRGIEGDSVYEGDEFLVDASAGVVIHKYSTQARAKAGNKLLGAWARVEREGRRPSLAYLTFNSRSQTSPFWTKDPQGQIAKCARAHVLRLAYPNVFAGAYIAEEMNREIEINDPPVQQQSASATEELEQRLRARLKVVKVEPTPLGSDTTQTVATPAEKEQAIADALNSAAKAAAATVMEKKSTQPPITHLRFGPAKGTALADASTIELEEALEVARKNVANLKEGETPKWLAGTLEGIAAAEAEIEKRDEQHLAQHERDEPGVAAPAQHANPRDGQTTAREPGSEG